ncbi:Holliday junction DNA helicase RuvA [Labilithrix luteola]|uniref:Holliday junction branch migration complex subunit RuvA n=1 Tax=Labilithrix luteola TaxID=1391654 RepID=A0A0K1PS93_9BACT|nr:Holliday junction branch migration protein RuvA [Labilithrix luteola]AKU96410.1 Holliday junction DNA helicase RuvA [Labilithrix luteola]
MIGRLTGRVTQEDDGTIVVDVNGVGYEVIVPLGTIGRAKADPEGRVTLFIHTHVREDVFSLFGFASDGDRLAFRTLIGVSSVGPKTAIAVLSALPAPDLGQAIARKELGKLTSISGIGKKTAERLLLELKDKLPILEAAGPRGTATAGAAAAAPASTSSASDLLARALINMGYRQAEADRAIEQLGGKVFELGLPDLLKEALAVLSK